MVGDILEASQEEVDEMVAITRDAVAVVTDKLGAAEAR
jgi:hypothetical protein